MRDISGGYCGGVPPLPIPNREVKPACADGTAMQCGRVGGRHLYLRALIQQWVRAFFVCRSSFSFPSCFHFLRILLTLKSPAWTLLKNGSSLHNFCNRLSVRRLGHEGWPFKPSCSLHIELCDKNRPFTLQKWLTFASKVAYFYIKSGLLFIVNGIVMNVKWRGDSLWQSMKALWRQHEGSKGQPSCNNRLIINKITFSMKALPMF